MTSSPGSSGSRDIRLLEGALAHTLTEAEKAAIAAAATSRDVALKGAVTSFETQVAELDAKAAVYVAANNSGGHGSGGRPGGGKRR